MKRNLLFSCITLMLSLSASRTNAQIVFHENFESVDSMSSSGTPIWFHDSNFQTSGAFSIRDTVVVGGIAYLTSNAFSTIGNFFVQMHFNQVCKLNFADKGYIEVSNDNGNNWIPLTGPQYNGTSTLFASAGYFSSFSYGANGWDATNDLSIPQASWWRTESFNISSLTSNAAQVKIRFKIMDGNGNGNSGNYGWLIDDVNVSAAVNELIPPVIKQGAPLLQGAVYNLGPYIINDTITDISGIDTAKLYYSINGGVPVAVTMINVSGNIWQGTIPAINMNDTVCYYVTASDPYNNTAVLPTSGCTSFIAVATTGFTIPFSDNFDGSISLWTTATGLTSTWETGIPNYGVTNSAFSPPNSWDINLNSAYGNNASSKLTSPIFNFSGLYNAKLSFWMNRNIASGDGAYMEYSTTGGATWFHLGFVNDPNAVNSRWYNNTNIGGFSGWDGNSGGWVNYTYILGPTFNNQLGAVQFRFIFTSNATITSDGISIDNFSITPAALVDAKVSAINTPGITAGAGALIHPAVTIKNVGTSTLTSMDIGFRINGGISTVETWSGTLAPSVSIGYTFTGGYTVPLGSYDICSYTSLIADGDHTNDTLCKTSLGLPLIPLPYSDNFDTPPMIWADSSAPGTTWELGTPGFGATNSAYSIPNSIDINLNSAYGNNARSVLTSPLFNFTGIYNARFSFWMNRNIETGDGVYIEYSTNGGTNWFRLGVLNDQNAIGNLWYNNSNINGTNFPGWDGNSGGWKKYTYILGLPFNNAGTNVRFRFVFISNGTTTGDGVSIDDMSIIPASAVDAAISAINQPALTNVAGSTVFPQVTLRNRGATTLTSMDVGYMVNGLLIAVQTWTGTLVSSGAANFTFTTSYTVPAGSYSFCAYTLLLSDGDHSNDTLCKTPTGIPRLSLPYSNDFESGPGFWSDSSSIAGTNWQLGTPAYGQTTGAHSPNSCWDLNLTTSYGNSAKSYLMSPLFDFTGITNARLSFWQNRNTEYPYDGMRLEYSVNAGVTWAILGTYNDPNSVNWYNRIGISSTGIAGWDSISLDAGGTPGWQQSVYRFLPSYITGPNVRFRFVFTSDATFTTDGISIDDFTISGPPPHDVGVTNVIHLALAAPANSTDSIKVLIHNFGSDTTSNFPVSYRINSGSIITQMYTGTLQPGANDTVSFNSSYVIPAGAYLIKSWTSAFNDADNYNDTLNKIRTGLLRFTIPYYDNFDTGLVAWYDSSARYGTNWEHGAPSFGLTTGSHSFPDCWDINLNSAYADSAESYLYSPLFDFTGVTTAHLSFWQNRFTENAWDGTRLEYSVNAGQTWTILGSQNDTTAVNWYNKSSIISSSLPAWDSLSINNIGNPGWLQSVYRVLPPDITGQNVQFRFVFTADPAVHKDGISIDDFIIAGPVQHDVGVTTVIRPGLSTPVNTIDSIIVVVYNFGIDTTSDFPVSYRIDTGNVFTMLHSGPLQPGESDTLQFSNSFIVSGGAYNISSWTSAFNDGDPTNDTLRKNTMGLLRFTIPYSDHFDSTLVAWYDSSAHHGTNWEHGTPTFGQTTGAHSNASCWDINLHTAYQDSAECYLISPLFDFTGITNARLSFWQNRFTEHGFDGTRLEYSVDAGNSWMLLGNTGDTNSVNWYNQWFIFSSNLPAWDSISADTNGIAGWIKSTYLRLPANITGPNVQFRFVFTSEYAVTKDGISIDDFQLYVPVITDIKTRGNNSNNLKIYPNPSAGIFYLQKESWMKSNTFIVVTDVLGKEIWKGEPGKMNYTTIDLSSNPNGIYFINVTSETNNINRRIVLCK